MKLLSTLSLYVLFVFTSCSDKGGGITSKSEIDISNLNDNSISYLESVAKVKRTKKTAKVAAAPSEEGVAKGIVEKKTKEKQVKVLANSDVLTIDASSLKTISAEDAAKKVHAKMVEFDVDSPKMPGHTYEVRELYQDFGVLGEGIECSYTAVMRDVVVRDESDSYVHIEDERIDTLVSGKDECKARVGERNVRINYLNSDALVMESEEELVEMFTDVTIYLVDENTFLFVGKMDGVSFLALYAFTSAGMILDGVMTEKGLPISYFGSVPIIKTDLTAYDGLKMSKVVQIECPEDVAEDGVCTEKKPDIIFDLKSL